MCEILVLRVVLPLVIYVTSLGYVSNDVSSSSLTPIVVNAINTDATCTRAVRIAAAILVYCFLCLPHA